jgi:hypothetical protein
MRKYFLLASIVMVTEIEAQVFELETVVTLKDSKTIFNQVLFGNKFYGVDNSSVSKFTWMGPMGKRKYSCKLLSYDINLNPVKEISLGDGKEIFGPFSPFLKVINKNLYLIYYQSENNSTLDVYAAKVDTLSLGLATAKKVLTIVDESVASLKLIDVIYSEKLLVEQSADKSKIIWCWTSGFINDYSFAVTDGDMNMLGKASHGKLENAKEFTIGNILVDNTGNFFVTCWYEKKNVYYPSLLAGNVSGTVKAIDVKLEGTFAHHVYVAPGSTEDYVKLTGTACKEGEYITEIFSTNIDKKGLGNSKLVMKEIDEYLIEQFKTDKYAKTKNKESGLNPYIQFEHFTMADGTIILAGDLTRFLGQGHAVLDDPAKGSSAIIVFTAAGEIIIKRLPKKEFLGLKTGNNFFVHKWEDKLVLLYTDLESNVNTALDQARTAGFNSNGNIVMVAATIEKDGKITRRILHPDAAGFYFSPTLAQRVDDNTILLGFEKDKVSLANVKTSYAFFLLKMNEE